MHSTPRLVRICNRAVMSGAFARGKPGEKSGIRATALIAFHEDLMDLIEWRAAFVPLAAIEF